MYCCHFLQQSNQQFAELEAGGKYQEVGQLDLEHLKGGSARRLLLQSEYPIQHVEDEFDDHEKLFKKKFIGSEVCLERCDSYGDFGFKKRKKNIFILREFCKRTHCPPIVTLALLLFLETMAIKSGELARWWILLMFYCIPLCA